MARQINSRPQIGFLKATHEGSELIFGANLSDICGQRGGLFRLVVLMYVFWGALGVQDPIFIEFWEIFDRFFIDF